MMKRIFDLIVAIPGLIFLTPLFILIGLFIKLNDKGPVFFKQKRVGKEGKLFILYKFRSMRILKSASMGTFEPGNCMRITSFGKILRKTKLDELPQLFNVLIGDMSLVGPRPEVEKWVNVYPERWKQILSIRPGMTDNASIMFSNEETLLVESNNPEKTYEKIILPKKLELYENYVLNQSFIGDLKIIIATLKCLVYKK